MMLVYPLKQKTDKETTGIYIQKIPGTIFLFKAHPELFLQKKKKSRRGRNKISTE